jgi:prefoldin alpha subunit
VAEKPAAEPTEAELRELVARGDALRQQLAALDSQRDLLAELAGDAKRSLSTLEHLGTATDGEELLVPLGAGAFVRARLAGEGRVIAALGVGIHADMPVADARARMDKRVESLDAAAAQSAKDASRVADEIARINAVVESYYGGA